MKNILEFSKTPDSSSMKKVKQCQETSQGIKKLESARNDTGGILETKQPAELSQLLSLEDNN